MGERHATDTDEEIIDVDDPIVRPTVGVDQPFPPSDPDEPIYVRPWPPLPN
jgi:hypothetical protein